MGQRAAHHPQIILSLVASAVMATAACSSPAPSPSTGLASEGSAHNAPPQAAGGAPGQVLPQVTSREARFVRAVDPALYIRLTIALRPRREELHDFVRSVSDPSSPLFRKFLSFDEAKARFSPSDSDVAAVEAWTRSLGLHETDKDRANHAFRVAATVGTVNSAFKLQLNEYELDGHHIFANDRAPTIRADMAPAIAEIFGLESARQAGGVIEDIPFPRVSASAANADPTPRTEPTVIYTPEPSLSGRQPQITGPRHLPNLFEPEDLWSSEGYDFAPLREIAGCCGTPGAESKPYLGSAIAFVEFAYPTGSDLRSFFNEYGVNAGQNGGVGTVWLVHVGDDGIPFPGGSSGLPSPFQLEATQDVEWAGAMLEPTIGTSAVPANMYIYACGATVHDLYWGCWDAIDSDDQARIFSASVGAVESAYGGLFETSIGAFYDVAQDLTAKGWTLVGSSGDRGSASDGGGAQYPGSDPYFISVGGTTLKQKGSSPDLGTFQSEVAWEGPSNPARNQGGGGGGCSGYFQPPSWQESFVLLLERTDLQKIHTRLGPECRPS
jgi:kumamolisin